MSEPTFVSPIPTKSYESTLITSPRDMPSRNSFRTPSVGTPGSVAVPPLEDLIAMCYKFHLKAPQHPSDDISDYDRCLVLQFKKYVVELHCEENLKFLLEIYKYETIFDSLFPDNDNLRLNTPSPKPATYMMSKSVDEIVRRQKEWQSKSCVGLPVPSSLVLSASACASTVAASISNANGSAAPIYGVGSVSKAVSALTAASTSKFASGSTCSKCPSYSKPPSVISISTIDNEPVSVFASQMSDLGIKEAKANIWDDLMLKEVDQDNESDSDSDSVISSVSIKYEDQEKLQSQWNQIVKKYVGHDAPLQINLSDLAFREILIENSNAQGFHSPNYLLRAKNEVMQLIKENAYISFTKMVQANPTNQERCDALGIKCKTANQEDNCSCTATKSISSPLTPMHSENVNSAGPGKGKALRLRNLASSPSSQTNSSSSSSLSALLGYFKIGTSSHSNSSSPGSNHHSNNNNSHNVHMPNGHHHDGHGQHEHFRKNAAFNSHPVSTTHSLSPSPILLQTAISNDSMKEEHQKHKLRLWKNKK